MEQEQKIKEELKGEVGMTKETSSKSWSGYRLEKNLSGNLDLNLDYTDPNWQRENRNSRLCPRKVR